MRVLRLSRGGIRSQHLELRGDGVVRSDEVNLCAGPSPGADRQGNHQELVENRGQHMLPGGQTPHAFGQGPHLYVAVGVDAHDLLRLVRFTNHATLPHLFQAIVQRQVRVGFLPLSRARIQIHQSQQLDFFGAVGTFD